MAKDEDHPRVEVQSRAQLRHWLAENHETAGTIWLVTYKKVQADKHVPYDDIVEEALCFGWVDSLPRKLDADRTMLRLSPRKPGSAWSGLNKARIARLEQAGLMHRSGHLAVVAARQDGSWSFLDDVERLEKPEDLVAALEEYSAATAFFDAFPRSVQRGILEWIKQAKKPETRQKRIDATARLAAENRRANQFR